MAAGKLLSGLWSFNSRFVYLCGRVTSIDILLTQPIKTVALLLKSTSLQTIRMSLLAQRSIPNSTAPSREVWRRESSHSPRVGSSDFIQSSTLQSTKETLSCNCRHGAATSNGSCARTSHVTVASPFWHIMFRGTLRSDLLC